MSVIANSIMDALVTAVATDFTAGESGHNLSVAGLVVEGSLSEPPVGSASPFVAIGAPTIGQAPDIWNLSEWGRRLTCQIMVWAPSPDVPMTRRQNALKLAHDIVATIEDARYSDTQVAAFEPVVFLGIEIDAIIGNEAGMQPGYGLAVISLEIIYQSARGY